MESTQTVVAALLAAVYASQRVLWRSRESVKAGDAMKSTSIVGSAMLLIAASCGLADGGEVIVPSVYFDAKDSFGVGDEPNVDFVAGPGGDITLSDVPSRLTFSGFVENLTWNDDRLYVVVESSHPVDPSYAYFYACGTDWPDVFVPLPASATLPPVEDPGPPIRVAVECEIALPFSPPEVTLRLFSHGYHTAPGLHVAGSLTYSVGVPEPSGIFVVGSAVASVTVMVCSRRKSCRRRIRRARIEAIA